MEMTMATMIPSYYLMCGIGILLIYIMGRYLLKLNALMHFDSSSFLMVTLLWPFFLLLIVVIIYGELNGGHDD